MTMEAPPTRPTSARRFGLLDVMILVAAAALGLAGTRWCDSGGEASIILREVVEGFAWDRDYFDQVVPELLFLATPPAVTLTLGVLALRLRKPRPRWRKLARQPGLAACFALMLAWVAAGAFAASAVAAGRLAQVMPSGGVAPFDPASLLEPFALAGSMLGGFGVVVAWATLRLVGRWRAEPTWPDRLGRLVGLAWVAMALAGFFSLRTLF